MMDPYDYEKLSKQAEDSYRNCSFSLLGILILVIIALFMSSCATKIVTVPEIHYEYITKHDSIMIHDSISVHDSVVVKQSGDTIFCDRWHTFYKDRWHTKVLIDSIIRTDTIAVPYPVKKKLTKWQQIKLDCGEFFIIAIVVIFLILVALLYLRRPRQRNI